MVCLDALPHIHSNVKDEPRFCLSHSGSVPHVDFLEFLLRNYRRPEWQNWADLVWDKRVYPSLPGHIRQTNQGNTRDAIRTAFTTNKPDKLANNYKDVILKWKEKLRLTKVILHQTAVTLRVCPGGAPTMILG